MPTLLVINSPNHGDWFTLGQVPLTLGRDEELLAELGDPYVSQRHVELRLDPRDGRFYAIDLGSRNGVVVNGVRIHRLKALREGDLIQVGHTLIVFTDTYIDHYRAAERMIQRLAKRYRLLIEKIEHAADEQHRLNALTGTHGYHAIASTTYQTTPL